MDNNGLIVGSIGLSAAGLVLLSMLRKYLMECRRNPVETIQQIKDDLSTKLNQIVVDIGPLRSLELNANEIAEIKKTLEQMKMPQAVSLVESIPTLPNAPDSETKDQTSS
jgi:hypothetical protein